MQITYNPIKMEGIFSKPNQITFIRILLIPIFVMFLLSELPYKNYIAAFIFIMLSLSDALDGYIARKHNQITKIGKIIDPIADKLLISAALIFLVGRIELWMVVVIIARELIITLLRIFFLPKKVVISASYLGKIKTISQIIAILAVILNLPFNWWLMLLAVIITVVSGFDYIVKMGNIMGENVLNLPNMITTFRLLLIPLIVINIMKSNVNYSLIIVAIFTLLDKLDGIFARVTHQITRFGRVYDAFTDFVGIVSVFAAFIISGILELYWVVIFIVPVVIISITRLSTYLKTKQTISGEFGKILIGISYVAGIAILIGFAYVYYLLLIVAILAYAYTIFDIYKLLQMKKHNN
tara:strand:- start:1017 stop:2075 length:1059 start_codon:yes stop_codon:yes gene_type:complete